MREEELSRDDIPAGATAATAATVATPAEISNLGTPHHSLHPGRQEAKVGKSLVIRDNDSFARCDGNIGESPNNGTENLTDEEKAKLKAEAENEDKRAITR